MADNDLSTSFKPSSNKAGSIQYDFSDELEANSMNIIQKGTPSNAKVSVRVVKNDSLSRDGEPSEWMDYGYLTRSLNQFGSSEIDKILPVKIE